MVWLYVGLHFRIATMSINAFVSVLFANQRAKPNHRSELVNQVLFGHKIIILDSENGWYLCKSSTPEYEGWIEGKEISLVSANNLSDSIPIYYKRPYGFIKKNNVEVVPTTMGMALYKGTSTQAKENTAHDLLGVEYEVNAEDWSLMNEVFQKDQVPAFAKAMLHAPYLWGGCTALAPDCSGLVWLSFFLSGRIMPRDASQQAKVGVAIDAGHYGMLAEPGDLHFFTENGKSISHVAVSLGQSKYIHASGKVQLNSLHPEHEDYDEYRAKSRVMTRRIS